MGIAENNFRTWSSMKRVAIDTRRLCVSASCRPLRTQSQRTKASQAINMQVSALSGGVQRKAGRIVSVSRVVGWHSKRSGTRECARRD
jgi:hypothetical protein